MNLYLLVEGKSEKFIYPAWLRYLLPGVSQVKSQYDVVDNDYYLFSSQGIPSILDDIPNAIKDMNEIGTFDYLVIILDADDLTVEERKDEVFQAIGDSEVTVDGFDIVVIVQNRCIETWCLGNRKVYARQPVTTEFRDCSAFYNVKDDDPDHMPKDGKIGKVTTIAQYHEYYLSKMLLEKNLSYTKGRGTKDVQAQHYLEEMLQRIHDTDHLDSFRAFIDFTSELKERMASQAEAAPTTQENNQAP